MALEGVWKTNGRQADGTFTLRLTGSGWRNILDTEDGFNSLRITNFIFFSFYFCQCWVAINLPNSTFQST